MKARKPKFDFSATPAHWAPNVEFAQSLNASSLWIPHLERYLNRVMAQAMPKLVGDDASTEQIRRDIRMFIRQETNHYTLHTSFNQILYRSGYDVAAMETRFKQEFERLIKTKSLAFLCAYCEGFETISPAVAALWLDHEVGGLIDGARPEVVALWKWHLTEEFEHRTVCHDVFKRIHGGYFMRLYGFFYQLHHLNGFTKMVLEHLLACDRKEMNAEEVRASKKRAKAAQRKFIIMIVPYLLRALLPFHDPRKAREPKQYRSYLARIESGLG